MNAPTLVHNLKEKVTCSVCSNVYTNPKQLPCFHIFCLECLNNLARASDHHDKIKCPLCQTEVTVPETGTMETLPSCAVYVRNLLDILAIKECNTWKVTCGNCEKKIEEASYCFHCGKFCCHACLNKHDILKENKEHRVLAVQDFQEKDFEDVLKWPVSHVSQANVTVEQSKHSNEEMTATAVNNNISSKLDAAKKSLTTISNSIQQIEETFRLLDYRSKINKELIKRTVKSLIVMLRQKEQESIAEVENQTKQTQEHLRKLKDEIQDRLNKRGQYIAQIEGLVHVQLRMGVNPERSNALIDELFQGIQEPQDQLDIPPNNDLKTFHVFVKNETISESLQTLGIGHLATKKTPTEATQCSVKVFQAATAGLETEIKVITRDSEGEQCYCPGDYITVKLISAEDRNTAVEMKVIDKNDGSYTISFIPSEAGPQLPIVQVNGDTIRDFPPILVKERSFTPVGFIPKETTENQSFGQILCVALSTVWTDPKDLNFPWGVAVDGANEVFVTDMNNNRIVVFNEQGEFIRSFGQNLVNKPTGICIDTEGRIFVANRSDNKILLFNPNGEYVTTLHNGESLNEPRGISLDLQGNLIVCDSGNKCVRLISPNGSILKTIGSDGLCMPFGCLCYGDKVFVSDHGDHFIKVYSYSSGRFLYEFGLYGTVNEELNEPTGLAMDKEGHLLVCSGNYRIHVYTLDGKFVKMFGESGGRDFGQLRQPISVSVLKNGRIVVCEFENRRLQIFE